MNKLYYIAIQLNVEESTCIYKLLSDKNLLVYDITDNPFHITLFQPFALDNNFESILVKRLHFVAHKHYSFSIYCRQFGQFDERTVFIDIINCDMLIELQRKVSQTINVQKVVVNGIQHSNYTPHITILKNIQKDEFVKIWNAVKTDSFNLEFSIDKFQVLTYQAKRWVVIDEVHLSVYKPPLSQ